MRCPFCSSPSVPDGIGGHLCPSCLQRWTGDGEVDEDRDGDGTHIHTFSAHGALPRKVEVGEDTVTVKYLLECLVCHRFGTVCHRYDDFGSEWYLPDSPAPFVVKGIPGRTTVGR